ncbi:unnamed protein product [Larinioides sclopetarius]|uniref:mRNA export factor GLE1 n=1 Tax=Larinioides sclopetarius TaxID=280406 RepID=A0AAV1ZEV1_9ARAC
MDVSLALKNSSKGQLKYDRYWAQEGRTKGTLDEISKKTTNITLCISPKTLSLITSEICDEEKSNERVVKEDIPVTSPKANKQKSASEISDCYFYERQSEMELPILEFEAAKLQYMLDVFNSKKQKYDNHSSELLQRTNQDYKLLKRKSELDAKRRVADLEKVEQLTLEEARQKERLQRERYETHAKKLSAKVIEAEMKQKKAVEEMKKRAKDQTELKVQLNNCQKEAENSIAKSIEKLASFEHQDYLRIPQKDRLNQMAKVLQSIKAYTEKAKTEELLIDDILNANLNVKEAYEIYQDIVNDMESAKSNAIKSHEKATSFSFKETSLPGKANNHAAVANSQTQDCTTDSKSSEANKDENGLKMLADVDEKPKNDKEKEVLSQFIAPDAIEDHLKIKEKLEHVEGVIQPFKADTREQGDTQISAQHSAAFPFAMAILGIWSRKPEVGSLILGHFYSLCPYLVPFYPPRQEGMSDSEYLSILGYYIDDEGVVEEKYKFLNRMSGYVRLYAAIIVAPLPADVKDAHPHGLAWGWRWLSRILNLEPRPDITATVLYDFLDVTGHSLQKVYGKQFKKIIHILCKDFFPKIKQVTPGGSGGPVERLETFLQNTAKKGYISPPDGFLDVNFWNR